MVCVRYWLVSSILVFCCACSYADLQSDLSAFKSMQADFTEVATTPQGGRLSSQGAVWLVKPNQFRWQVDSPNQQLYVTDGVTLWSYEADLQQVIKQPLGHEVSQTPILLLSGLLLS